MLVLSRAFGVLALKGAFFAHPRGEELDAGRRYSLVVGMSTMGESMMIPNFLH